MGKGLCHGAGLLALIFCIGVSAHAHTPHDAIDVLHISPDYENDTTLYVIVQNNLLRSTDRGGSWKQLVAGIDTPHLLSDISISREFAEDGTLFLSTDGGGVYVSRDRGRTWDRFNTGLGQPNVGMLLAADSSQGPAVLAAGTSKGLFVSMSGDESWRRVISDDVQITALQYVGDRTSTRVIAGDASGGVWRGSPDLKRWERLFRIKNAGAITALEAWHSSESNDTLYIGTEKAGLLQSLNGELPTDNLSSNWPARTLDCNGRPLESPVSDLHIRDIEILVSSEDDQPGIYVTTHTKAVHASIDSGRSWALLSRGLSCDSQADQTTFDVPHFRDMELGRGASADWFLAGFDGLFRSSDGGETWTQLEALTVDLIRGFEVSPGNAKQHGLAVTTYGGGAYISDDNGRTWLIANPGLVTTRLADIEFSPNYWTDNMIFTLSSERLLSSRHRGNHWSPASLVYQGWRRRVGAGLERRLGFSPEYGTRLFLSDAEREYVWPMQIELSPEFADDKTILLGLRRHGVWKSEDGGVEWSRDWDGPVDYVTALEMSPGFAVDGTAFAGIRGSGIYVTRDWGESWQPANEGFWYLDQEQAVASPNYVIDPPLLRAIKDVLLLVSPNFVEDQIVFASSSAGLFQSKDGGVSWTGVTVESSLENVPVIAIGVSPDFGVDETIIASFKGRGIYRSMDGGTTFEFIGQDLLDGNFDLKYIRFSPSYRNDAVIYGATEQDLLVSRDHGITWSVIDRPVRYEDWRGSGPGPVWFDGDWSRESGPEFSASAQTVSVSAGANVSFSFNGNGITWRGETGPNGGLADVLVDGNKVAFADLYSRDTVANTAILTIPDLEAGSHVLEIEVSSGANPNSGGHRVVVDSFDVLR
jgi:photosystem II stability/assembly factor-like uncharacterized protein